MSRTRGKSLCCLSATMRHAFILTLFCILQIPVLAQTTRSLPQPRQAQGSDFSTNSASVRDWANRLMARDAEGPGDRRSHSGPRGAAFAALAETIPQPLGMKTCMW